MRAPRGSYRLALAVGGSEGPEKGLPVLGVRVFAGVRVLDLERASVARLDRDAPGWRERYAWAPTTTGVHVYLEEWARGGATTPPELARAGHDLSYQARAYQRGWFHERVRPARIRVPAGASASWRERLEQHAEGMNRALKTMTPRGGVEEEE